MTVEPRVWIGEDEGQTALFVGGVVQSVVVDDGPLGPGYWPLMLPDVRPGRALILGLGGGTIAHLLSRRFGDVFITGVENDAAVLRLARGAFGLTSLNLKVVEDDAFAFVAGPHEPYDYVAVDLFAKGSIPGAIFGRPFLRRVRELLTPGGLVAFNFFKDKRRASRVARLEAVFPRVQLIESRDNLVARCRRR